MYYGLILSMMRDEKSEYSDRFVCWAEKREDLEEFIARERVEPWVDENPGMANLNGNYTYNKVFRKGGPLEWYNPYSHQFGDEYIVPLEDPIAYSERIRLEAYAARQEFLEQHIKIGPRIDGL